MGIATPPLYSVQFLDKQNSSNSMSHDYHQGIFSFSNGFERSQQEQQQQHIAQQIRRDKLRVQGFGPPPPLVGMEEDEVGGLPVYETAGILSDMFNFPPGGAATATELLQTQMSQSYRNPRAAPPTGGASHGADWFLHRQDMVVDGGLGDSKNQTVVNDTAPYHHHHNQQHQISSINVDSAAAMQLFPPPPSTSSSLHLLLPNPSSSSTLQAFNTTPGGAFSQFTWVPSSGNENNANEIPGVVEGQGLSLSLSSSLQQLEVAKAEELRIGEGGMLFFGQGGGGSTPPQYQFKNLGGGGVSQNRQLHVGLGPSFGAMNMLRDSKYAKAAQELLEEFCGVGRGQLKKNNTDRQNNNKNPISNPTGGATSAGGAAGGGNSSSSSKDLPPLSASGRLEHQRRKVKLLSMLDEASNLPLSLSISELISLGYKVINQSFLLN